MSDLGNIIVQGGLTLEEHGKQKNRRGERALRAHQRDLMHQQLTASQGLLPMQTELAKGGLEAGLAEQAFQEGVRPTQETLRKQRLVTEVGDARALEDARVYQRGMEIKDAASMAKTRKWGRQAEQIAAQLDMSARQFQQEIMPLLQEAQRTGAEAQLQQAQDALNTMKLQQSALLWRMLKQAGPKAALDIINSNNLILGEQTYADIYITDAEGNRVDKPGKATNLVLVDQDGVPQSVPVENIEQVAEMYGKTYETLKEGETQVVRDSTGRIVSSYTVPKTFDPKGRYKEIESTGGVLDTVTGNVTDGQGGQAGRSMMVTKNDKALDKRVNDAHRNVLIPQYGGRFEGGIWFPDDTNKAEALEASRRTEEYIRRGMDPVAAAAKAVGELRKQSQLDATLGGGVTGGEARTDILDSVMPQNY